MSYMWQYNFWNENAYFAKYFLDKLRSQEKK
jgi:hypothetical protein